jgi:dimethylamine/trimethylamine dehydrogenase
VEAASVIMVTSRAPRDGLYRELGEQIDILRVGDCLAPGTIASAVYSGHRYAREMDEAPSDGVPFLREHALAP